jgi:hypothetical protein
MLYSYITTATTTQVYSPSSSNQEIRKVHIQVNAALTGTITVIDGTAGTTANVAVITNPTVGSSYEYWGLTTGVRIVTSATCDITVSCDLSPAGR